MSAIQSRRRRPIPLAPEIDPPLRARIETAIEALLAVLDAADGDLDLEEGHDAEAVNEDGDPLDDEEINEGDLGQSVFSRGWLERNGVA